MKKAPPPYLKKGARQRGEGRVDNKSRSFFLLFFLRALRALFFPLRWGSNGCKCDHPTFWGKGLVFKRGAFKMKAPGFRV